MNYSKLQEFKNRQNLQSVLLKLEVITGLLSHLCVSIWALLPRELLEDRGQTAEHKDGTARKRRQALKLQLSHRRNVYHIQKCIHILQIKSWKCGTISLSAVQTVISTLQPHQTTVSMQINTFILQISKANNYIFMFVMHKQ